jgi:hypothetical protein
MLENYPLQSSWPGPRTFAATIKIEITLILAYITQTNEEVMIQYSHQNAFT